MKIATFNIQNLFHRDTNLLKANKEIKSSVWREEFEALYSKKQRLTSDYIRMRELAKLLGFSKPSYEPYLSMQNIEGSLLIKSSMEVMETKASYFTDWNGWTKLKSIPIPKKAISNKAKVILEVNPDIILLQEVENRQSLNQFNESFFGDNQNTPYTEIMHLQGNDCKNIGMGILLKKGYRIQSVISFSNERDEKGVLLFQKDFIRFKIKTPENEILYLFGCQFIDENESDALRKRQAEKVAKVYRNLLSKGVENIIIMGTLNAPSYSDSISPLMNLGLKDIVSHTSFSVASDSGKDAGYFRMGAYQMGVNIKQKDYLLVSPSLFERISKSGMNRKALWPLKKPEWDIYESVKNEKDAASDHPLLWADLKLKNMIKVHKLSA
jgi:endonuclease/exonuclease/phosphatase family metal-dependent hydrolase